MSDWVQFLPVLALLVLFWLLLVRPARKRQQQFADLQASLAVGQRVMTTSGIYGELVEVGDDTVGLRIAAATDITLARAAIARVLEPSTTEPDSEDAA